MAPPPQAAAVQKQAPAPAPQAPAARPAAAGAKSDAYEAAKPVGAKPTSKDAALDGLLLARSSRADHANQGNGAGPPALSAQLAAVADPAVRTKLLTLIATVNPQDRDALLSAHQSGVLTRPDPNGQTVLDHLGSLAAGPLAPGVDRAEVLGQLIKDVSDPIQIFQGRRNTCGATSSSILLARARPAEYARIISELARPSGTATLSDGKSVIGVKPDALTDDSKRTITGRLLQPALMELANGKASYDNATEKHTRGLPKNIPGLTQPEVARLASALFGADYKVHGASMKVLDVVAALLPGNHPNRPRARHALEEGKKPALVLLNVDKGNFHIPAIGFHWVLVHEIKDGRVRFDDPNRVTTAELQNGTRVRPGDYRVEPDGTASMSLKDFEHVMWSVVSPD